MRGTQARSEPPFLILPPPRSPPPSPAEAPRSGCRSLALSAPPPGAAPTSPRTRSAAQHGPYRLSSSGSNVPRSTGEGPVGRREGDRRQVGVQVGAGRAGEAGQDAPSHPGRSALAPPARAPRLAPRTLPADRDTPNPLPPAGQAPAGRHHSHAPRHLEAPWAGQAGCSAQSPPGMGPPGCGTRSRARSPQRGAGRGGLGRAQGSPGRRMPGCAGRSGPFAAGLRTRVPEPGPPAVLRPAGDALPSKPLSAPRP